MIHLTYMFKVFFETSIKGSILILLILLFQKIFSKDFTSRWIYSLWILVFIRLLMPFTPIKNVISLYKLSLFHRFKYGINDILIGKSSITGDEITYMGKSVSIDPLIRNSLAINFISIISIIWIIGISILLIFFCYIVIKVNKLIKGALINNDLELKSIIKKCQLKIDYNKKINIYISKEILSPMACGILNPKIVIPKSILVELDNHKLEHIILHELVHIKRKDIIKNYICMLICIIHWFNPIVWFSFIKSKRDCELACDESVLKYLSDTEYTQYGYTLIHLMELIATKQQPINPIIANAIMNDRTEANKRIFRISTYTKKRKILIVFSIIIMFFISYVSFNEPSSNRIMTAYAIDDLPHFLLEDEHVIRSSFNGKPRQTYALKIDGIDYYILDYPVLGHILQFWFRGDNLNNPVEITTTSFNNIEQGMHIEEANKVTKMYGFELKEVKNTSVSSNYIYIADDYNMMIVSDNKTNKVYSICLYLGGEHNCLY